MEAWLFPSVVGLEGLHAEPSFTSLAAESPYPAPIAFTEVPSAGSPVKLLFSLLGITIGKWTKRWPKHSHLWVRGLLIRKTKLALGGYGMIRNLGHRKGPASPRRNRTIFAAAPTAPTSPATPPTSPAWPNNHPSLHPSTSAYPPSTHSQSSQ